RSTNLAHGKLVAFDPIKQSPRWVVTLPLSVNSGVLATAGNLVFHGDASGELSGYAADSGKKIWSVKTGSAIQSVPVTYTVNGVWARDGEVPDLRYMPACVHQRFNAIV